MLGRPESDWTKAAVEQLSSMKKTYRVFRDVEEISPSQAENLSVIIVTADRWEETGDPQKLLEYAEKGGKSIIFSHLMQEDRGEGWNRRIGIISNQGPTDIEGMLLSEDLMPEGMLYYENLPLTVDGIRLDGRCGKLIVEWEGPETEAGDMIPLMWERRCGDGCFYGVNGDFLAGGGGLGLLTALLSRTSDIFVYPVVNAKVNLLDSFPEPAVRFDEEMQRLYSRDTDMFLRDIAWPSLIWQSESYGLVFTALSRGSAQGDELDTMLDMLRRRGCEVVTEPGELSIPIICSGHERSVESVFQMDCAISGAGLAVHYLDMAEVLGANANDRNYEWSTYSRELSELWWDLYRHADWVDPLSLSRAQERYNRYVMIRPEIRLGDSYVTIKTEEFNEICFYMIRTDRKVLPGKDYGVKQVGGNAWLIKTLAPEITVALGDETNGKEAS